MKLIHFIFLAAPIFICGCSFADPDESAIREMLKSFVASIERGDEDLGRACLLDMDGFNVINPDVGTRVDADAYTETVLAELIHNHRALVTRYEGRTLKLKVFTVGNVGYQYKGTQAFVNNRITISVDGTLEELPIKSIVKIGQQWKIVDLYGILSAGEAY